MKRVITTINDAVLAGLVDVQIKSMDAVGSLANAQGRPTRKTIALASLGAIGYAAPAAYAAGCSDAATNNLLKLISSIANFVIGLGAGLALLMLAVGGIMVVAGGTPQRVSQGIKIVKNVVIGLAILGLGAFIKTIVTTLISGAQSGAGTSSPACLKKGTI